MRVREGARKINSQGGAIHVHQERAASFSTPPISPLDAPQSPIAPIEVRDYVYTRSDFRSV